MLEPWSFKLAVVVSGFLGWMVGCDGGLLGVLVVVVGVVVVVVVVVAFSAFDGDDDRPVITMVMATAVWIVRANA